MLIRTLSINQEKYTKKNVLEIDFVILIKQLYEKHMVLKPAKCHWIMLGEKYPSHKIILNNKDVTSSD